jgi:branched-subunit amino acid ABC-type transport system permease component
LKSDWDFLENRSLNERITFIIAALAGELAASAGAYLYVPMSPLCVSFPTLLNYAGQHASLAAIVWLVVGTGAWLLMGPLLMRPRQNLSTKLQLLTWLGVVGIAIDNAVSLFQYINNTPETMAGGGLSRSVFFGFAVRTVIYAISFAAVVVISYLLSLTRRSTMTPPPDFGRE